MKSLSISLGFFGESWGFHYGISICICKSSSVQEIFKDVEFDDSGEIRSVGPDASGFGWNGQNRGVQLPGGVL